MKDYEYVGILLTIFAYAMIVSGNLFLGFAVGLLGNFALIIYFVSVPSFPTATLQAFFVCANSYGLYNLGIT